MIAATLDALARFPDRLEEFHAAVPRSFAAWAPASWDGIPSEHFCAIEQVCHVRDIELDGYQVRLRRALSESNPTLADIDGYALARERRYAQADAAAALTAFRAARAETVALLARCSAAQLARPAVFAGRAVSVRALAHYLCSHDQQHLAGLQWLLAQIAAMDVRA